VSSPDKEAIARLYGAAHVYDSRSLDFVDAVRDGHGGVDVVLNSLAGDAMRGSLKCLRPRGRFVELGKRDYVGNSLVGLRPFRRNLSYYGVDLDQLLALDPAMVTRGLREIIAGFAAGDYIPLPTMAHRAAEIGEAFRLMQSAGHVGKIVVSPPPLGTVASTAAAEFVPDDGVQLIVGGTRGFGLATALWLAERGAKRIVVASRSGELDPARQAAVDTARRRGTEFVVERVDVADSAEVDRLIARVAAAHGPISGVYLTAVTLSDGLIEGLTDEVLASVLEPKVKGVDNLDRATRGQPVKQFVLYSSASAFIGNPGQAAYAAANGYLEGVARRRRNEGLPALAVAWGAITDVGLLAGQTETIESLHRVAGVIGMCSSEALNELGQILALAERLDDPVVTCAEFAPGGALHMLPVSASPAFAALFAGRGTSIVESGVSLAELIAGKPEVEAHRLLATLVVEEVAQILRLAVQDVDLDASIDSLGMDSLMALELRMSIEAKHGIELPVMAVSAAGTLRELAHRILQNLRQAGGSGDIAISDAESALIAMHGGSGSGDPADDFAETRINTGSSH
jgi:NAD(P)-dependent dehydrogenase (short-subunit alcohol dehydrogenase family)/acyl carrier protein